MGFIRKLNDVFANSPHLVTGEAPRTPVNNDLAVQHGKTMAGNAARAAAEGSARDASNTPAARPDVAAGGGAEDSAIAAGGGRSKRKRQVFGGEQTGVNI